MDQHKNHIYLFSIYLLLLGVFVSDASLAKSKPKLTFSTGTTFTSGDYGTSHNTDIYYVPLTAKYKRNKWTYKLTVPYLRKTGPSNVLLDIGNVGTRVAIVKQKTEQGLGDIIASAKYSLFYHQPSKLFIDVTAAAKIATADEKKGLGTGENDYSLKFGFYYLSGDLTPYLTLGYKKYGENSTLKLRDVFLGSTGVSYKMSESENIGLNFSFKEKVSSSSTGSRVLTAFATKKLDKTWKLQGYLITGFSDSSPDKGTGFSVSHTF